MGMFDIFKKREAPAVPAPIAVALDADSLCSPVAGRAIALSEVPDPVFSGEVLGKGCAVRPEGDIVYSPVCGKVTVVMGHAVGIMSDSGIEVLVHVGIDTVNLQGEGFTSYVSQGDAVAAGQPVLKVDRAAIAAAGYDDCVILVVSNSADFEAVDMAVAPGTAVAPGDVIAGVIRGR